MTNQDEAENGHWAQGCNDQLMEIFNCFRGKLFYKSDASLRGSPGCCHSGHSGHTNFALCVRACARACQL